MPSVPKYCAAAKSSIRVPAARAVGHHLHPVAEVEQHDRVVVDLRHDLGAQEGPARHDRARHGGDAARRPQHAGELVQRVHRDVVHRPAAGLAEVPAGIGGHAAGHRRPLRFLVALVVGARASTHRCPSTAGRSRRRGSAVRIAVSCGLSTSPGDATSCNDRSAASAISSSASAVVVAMVLLTCTCLPASSAAFACSKCSPIGDAIETASTAGSASSSSSVS